MLISVVRAVLAIGVVMGVIAQMMIVLVNTSEDGQPLPRPRLAISLAGLAMNLAAFVIAVMLCMQDGWLHSPGPIVAVAGVLGACIWGTDLLERLVSTIVRWLVR